MTTDIRAHMTHRLLLEEHTIRESVALNVGANPDTGNVVIQRGEVLSTDPYFVEPELYCSTCDLMVTGWEQER